MKKRGIAFRLTGYFAVALIVFALIMGGLFVALFRNHTVRIHRQEMEARALSIAQTVAGYAGQGNRHGSHMMGGLGAYLRSLADIAGADAWVVDADLNLVTGGMMHGMMMNEVIYADLPPNADELVRQVFEGDTVFGQEFSGLLVEATLTVGVPVTVDGQTVAVVLLHSPTRGTRAAVLDGARLLGISLVAALAAAFALSFALSKRFTDPILSKEAQDALRLEKTRRAFIANISHELRTPVTVLRGSLEALTEGVVSEPAQVAKYHDQMLSETVYLQRLVGDLMDLSKLQSEEFPLETQPMSVVEAMRDAARGIATLAAQKEVRLTLDESEASKFDFQGDYGRIRQMLLILLDNAVKFSPPSSEVALRLAGRILTIDDQGPGIPAEDLPHIFERFYRTRSEQNKQGAGLGLAIAQQIAERHGLTIQAGTRREGGSRFTLQFP